MSLLCKAGTIKRYEKRYATTHHYLCVPTGCWYTISHHHRLVGTGLSNGKQTFESSLYQMSPWKALAYFYLILTWKSVPRIMSKKFQMHLFFVTYSQSNPDHRLVLLALIPIVVVFQLLEYFRHFNFFPFKNSA